MAELLIAKGADLEAKSEVRQPVRARSGAEYAKSDNVALWIA